MATDDATNTRDGFSRREFLYRVGAGVPTLSVAVESAAVARPISNSEPAASSDKFTPIDLSAHFNASPRDFGPRDRARAFLGGEAEKDGLVRTPAGNRRLQGAPFRLGPGGADQKSWSGLSTEAHPWTTPAVEIELNKKAHYICIASFCDWDRNETPAPGDIAIENLGQELAHCVLLYEDGGRHQALLRRRFETNSPREAWGHLSATALPPVKFAAKTIRDRLDTGIGWGWLQQCLGGSGSGGAGLGTLWICAIENPAPERTVRSLRFEALGSDLLLLAGVTLYHRPEFPFRYERRSLYRLTLPEAAAEDADRWKLDVDLGIVVSTFALPDFAPDDWLASPAAGLGEAAKAPSGARYLYAEIAASLGATLTLEDHKIGQKYEFELGRANPGQELAGAPSGSRIELVVRDKQWIHGRVLDSGTHRPTPVRLAFRSKEGRYIPPYGHREDINDEFFQDYGGDVKLMDTPFAYVDGTFQVELPVGEVYLEMTKGFEYQAVRQRLDIKPGQRELTVEIPRLANLRSEGWVTADTHTHFLSPTTALLEAQAEGLNLINLLAAQWGALFTNVGDLSHGPLVTPDRESMVWVGSENRQHVLGHLALCGVHGAPAFPLSADGPDEAFIGDPLWRSLAEWADTCRQSGGLAVCAHFPFPTGEIAADIILGKIDAVEVWPRSEVEVRPTAIEQFSTLRYRDWYHYLNCGFHVPAVGGTDKMGAYMPAGTNRCYTWIGQDEFTFANWAKGVRSGNTFVTSGPLLLFHAEGHRPGEEITLGAGGGTVAVHADAQSRVPIHKLEVIFNGRVVASHEEPAGARKISLREEVKVPGPGWLAARCSSQLGPTTVWRYKIAAHTSPVYVRVMGQELFSAPAAAYFMKLIDFAETYVKTLAIRPDAAQYAKILELYSQAREELHRRLHQQGVEHSH
ncbi:MAG TPA: CehA/McbA family metallohydrolase [Terriglobia bacterium]|nr:CehA/McbA family metallohydrolase [Terriglobia bacterium]